MHEQFQRTSIKALEQVNLQLIEVGTKFKSNRLMSPGTPAKESLAYQEEESKAEPDLQQLQLRPAQDSQVSESEQRIALANRESVTSESGGKKIKLDPQEEEWLKQLVNRNGDQLASLRHILAVYNQFYQSIFEENEVMKAEELKELEEEKQAAEEEKKQEEGKQNLAEEEKKEEAPQENKETDAEGKKEGEATESKEEAAQEKKEGEAEKTEEEAQKQKEEAAKAEKEKVAKEKEKIEKAKRKAEKAAQRQAKRESTARIVAQIREFQSSKIVADHMRHTNDVLAIVQSTNLDLLDSLTNNLACIFESYLPDLHELMLQVD